jgi:hypothetical protein
MFDSQKRRIHFGLLVVRLGLAAVFLDLVYVGPGRYAIAVKLEKK